MTGVSPDEDPVVAQPPATNRSWGRLMGAALFIGSGLALWVLLSVVPQLHGVVRTVLILGTVWGLYKGLDVVVKAQFGATTDTVFYVCAFWLALLLFAAVFADLLPLGEHKDTLAAIESQENQPPDLFSAHPLGTNSLGLDLLARAIYGARVSILIAGVTVVLIFVFGGLIGLAAGFYRGKLERLVGILADTLLAVPPLVLLIALATVMGRPETVGSAVTKISLGLALVGLPSMVRLARANTLTLAQREFVLAARGMGATNTRILLRELMPNVAIPLLAYALIVTALFILAEGSLSFLGLGLAPPEPTWGNMIAEGQQPSSLRNAPFVALVPGFFMFMTIFSFNRIGEHFRGGTHG